MVMTYIHKDPIFNVCARCRIIYKKNRSDLVVISYLVDRGKEVKGGPILGTTVYFEH